MEAIKARRDAASPGPWEAKAYRVYVGGDDSIIAACWRPWGPVTGDGSIEADVAFIAAARQDVPALVAEVERLRECLEPGKASAIVAAMFDQAERLGHSPFSSIHALTYLVSEVERLREQNDGLYAATLLFGKERDDLRSVIGILQQDLVRAAQRLSDAETDHEEAMEDLHQRLYEATNGS